MTRRQWDKAEELTDIIGAKEIVKEILAYMSADDMNDCLDTIERYHGIILEKNEMKDKE